MTAAPAPAENDRLRIIHVVSSVHPEEKTEPPIGLCYHSQTPASASFASIGAVAHTAIARGTAADPCPVRNDRRLGNGHFRPGPYLGSQASGGHSSARGVAEFHAGTYQCTATVLQHVEDIGGTAPSPKAAVSERGTALLTTLFTGTRNVASGFFTTVSAIERQER